MLKLSDVRNFGRTLAGLSLIVAPLLLLAASIIGPDLSDETAERLQEIADNEGAYIAGGYLFLAAPFALIPGLIGLMRVLRGRRVTVGQVGAGLILIGGTATIAFFGFGVFEFEAAQPGLDAGQMAQLSDNVDDSGLLVPLIVLFIGGLVLGSVLLAIGLWRQRAAPAWAALALGLSAIVNFLGEEKAISVIAFALLLIGLGPVGIRLLSMSDEEWERVGLEERPATPRATPG